MFTRLKQWFYRNVIKTSETTTVLGTKAAARKTYALMLKAEKAAMYKTSGEGVAYSTKNGSVTQGGLENSVNDDIISNDNRAQPNSASSINWVYKSELFSTEENILFHQKISEINQGSKAFAQNSQGEYMLPINNKIVFTNGDYNSPYISRVIEIMVDSMTDFENIRRMVFNFETGESKYNEAKRIIEISFGQESVLQYNSSNNNPVRWVNGRREGSNRREIVKRYQRERDARRNAESGTGSQSVSYSAKPSETAQRITENFGYTEATANNIVKSARSLRQKANSKADVNELAYTIAQTLEDRRNSNTDGRDAERIAMMLAENAEAVNEDFVAEYKPILDRLNGMTISISEANISDLGDAFSYVKKRSFPNVVLYI